MLLKSVKFSKCLFLGEIKRAYPSSRCIPKQGCSYHRWPNYEIQEMRVRHIMAHRLILYILFVEFCFGRSYSELNFQSNRYESNR